MVVKRLLVLSALLVSTASSTLAGYHYVAVTTADGEGGEMGSMTVEAWIDGGKAKIAFKESNNPMMGTGTYLLTQDGGETLYLVNPEEGTYSVWDLEEMMGALGGVMQSMSGFMKMEVSDPVVEKLLEEDGGSILGYPTTHYRYRTSYTMEMKVMGMKRGNRFESEQDIWSTTALDDEAFSVWLRNAPKNTGFQAFDTLVETEYSKVRGFPLKTIDRSTTTGVKESGRASASTTTMEVTTLEETAVSDSMFTLDPSYEEVPLMPMPGEVPSDDRGEESGDEEEGGGMFKKFKKRVKS